MSDIRRFRKIRCDGEVIDELMTAKDMLARGWQLDKVVRLEWHDGDRTVSMQADHGVLAIVVPGRRFVAAIEENGAQVGTLAVLNADGTVRVRISNTQVIAGMEDTGEYSWFEPARSHSSNVFGVVFRRGRDQALFQLDFDAATGAPVGVFAL